VLVYSYTTKKPKDYSLMLISFLTLLTNPIYIMIGLACACYMYFDFDWIAPNALLAILQILVVMVVMFIITVTWPFWITVKILFTLKG